MQPLLAGNDSAKATHTQSFKPCHASTSGLRSTLQHTEKPMGHRSSFVDFPKALNFLYLPSKLHNLVKTFKLCDINTAKLNSDAIHHVN